MQSTTVQKTPIRGKSSNSSRKPDDLIWLVRYSDSFANFWTKCPDPLRTTVGTLAVFLLGLAMSGDISAILVHLPRQLGYMEVPIQTSEATSFTLGSITKYFDRFWIFFLFSNIVSFGIYFGFGGFLHWYFYVSRRSSAAEWKCQPNTWMPTDLEIQEIKVGSVFLFIIASLGALQSCYISNGGYSSVYYNWNNYSLLWNIMQWPVVFLYQDYATYLIHRFYHLPWLYKHIHKVHHMYKTPTAFSATAVHPIEGMHIQLVSWVPLYTVPVHWITVYTILLYAYYHSIIIHSGINFKAHWWQPWQPDAIFHDNHHQYFHVNFGFNCWCWDKIHGTDRRKDRIYSEDTFYGTGKALTEATPQEIAADLRERQMENPNAYRERTLEFALSDKEVDAIIKAK